MHPQAESEVIEEAYTWLAGKHHPDVKKDPKSAERMKETNAAYELLSDLQKRAAYDQSRAASYLSLLLVKVQDQSAIIEQPPKALFDNLRWKGELDVIARGSILFETSDDQDPILALHRYLLISMIWKIDDQLIVRVAVNYLPFRVLGI